MSRPEREQLNSRKESFQPATGLGVPSSTPGAKWKGLVRNGVLPEIISLDEYDKVVTRGMFRTRKLIEEIPQNDVTPELALAYHREMFKEVHRWAGNFRTVGQTVIIGEFPGADPQRIAREMDLWAAQTQDMMSKARNAEDVLAAIAFSHIRFERCHPFKDGNGRTGRALMHSQLEASFGHKERERFVRSEYFAAIRKAEGKEPDLTAFVHLLAKREGLQLDVREKVLSPYRLAPFFHPVTEKSFQQDLAESQKTIQPILQIEQPEKAGLWASVKRFMGLEKKPIEQKEKDVQEKPSPKREVDPQSAQKAKDLVNSHIKKIEQSQAQKPHGRSKNQGRMGRDDDR